MAESSDGRWKARRRERRAIDRTPSVVRKLVERSAHALLMQTGGSAVAQAKSVIQQAQVVAIAPTSLPQRSCSRPTPEFMYILANPISDFVTIFCGAWKETGVEKLAVMADTSQPSTA
jgi:branched-chain amino acid transport system substrate-binding protein